ncbi:MAG: hypothetical protein ACD_81C00218G0014 [uncultured bacterium]|uniref:Uncharacterized protein n=2 Tax=Candidatus Wolfeibacteriota TaxID=1752735 RepID=A0A0G1K783_9BACT|nr:MAG: hypothetical protein ACD_81C00218G0014 [uncultured bacterium]KKR12778.1 MAG: hypothetical protein UT41_C0001G0322 [Candidatus Wolfebacteria bacterium GW2011_GWC2_39_22]KKT43709.1 MAG: hypothetical protein UW32_C0001G0301 [Candidatus Wolfebacteria bacterium GW2011_GWE2_44_13]HBI25560.1 hypothetical protein [Candidatus Wolfebacteria bacterium]
MDKQKLVAIGKDQLKGGIAIDQVRELLTYRGVEEKDVEEIMQEVLADESARPEQISGSAVVDKTDAALLDVSADAPLNPVAAKQERTIILLATIGAVIVAIAGSVVYFLYF